jgi:hypothetical protein
MNLRTRIENLEKRLLGSGPITLTMPNGRIETIPVPPKFRGGMLRLYTDLVQGKRPHEAALIRDCVEHNEPGGGRMVNLTKVMLEGAAELERKYTPEELARLDASE